MVLKFVPWMVMIEPTAPWEALSDPMPSAGLAGTGGDSSEVLFNGSVAVPQTKKPGATATGSSALKFALPTPSVVTSIDPRKDRASLVRSLEFVPWRVGLPKNSRR